MVLEEIPTTVIEYVMLKANSTAAIDAGGTMSNILPVILMVGIAAAALTILLTASQSIEKYRRFKRMLNFLAKTLGYAAYGSLTIVIIGVPCLAGYWMFTTTAANPQGTIDILQPIGIIIGLFIGLALLGYATKNKIWTKIFKYHKEEKQQKQIKENMKELPVGIGEP